MNADLNEIKKLFERYGSEFLDPQNKFISKLQNKLETNSKQEIIIKFGVDPTRPDIHLGHAVVFRTLRKLQDVGCKIVFLVGDFTARIGDPTGKSKVRPEIEQAEIEKNMQTYLEQVGKILDLDKTKFSWIRNSDWFQSVTDIAPGAWQMFGITPVNPNSFVGKALRYERSRMQLTHLNKSEVIGITLSTFLWTLRTITHQQLIARDMFQDRISKGEELYMHEMLYPVLQGIDSFVIARLYGSCDMEVGGTDQTFNMLMGRDVMKANNLEPQAVLSFNLLRGTDGKEKMSKSLDNYIAINDVPSDMFGKVMSIPDGLIEEYFKLCTDIPLSEIEEINQSLTNGENPKNVKMRLAEELVAIYHGDVAAKSARASFESTFSKGEFPLDAQVYEVVSGIKLCDFLVEQKIIESKSEFRRLCESGAVSIYPDNKISDPNMIVGEGEWKIRIGKKIFIVIRSK